MASKGWDDAQAAHPSRQHAMKTAAAGLLPGPQRPRTMEVERHARGCERVWDMDRVGVVG